MSEVTPDFEDGVPVDDGAEPEDAGIDHEASAEDVLATLDDEDRDARLEWGDEERQG